MAAKMNSDSFLPSGGFEYNPPLTSSRSSAAISPLTTTAPRTFPTAGFISSSNINNNNHPRPISPPQSRSPSAENASAAMLEDWRTYTTNLRTQFKGERAHMAADRARMEECMEEERGLWELERSYFVAQVAGLEAKLEKMRLRAEAAERRVPGHTSQPMSSSSSSSGLPKSATFLSRSLSVNSVESSSSHSVPQESGRDANGAVFYAPAPRNPTRTFDRGASNLRLDSIASGNESLLQVTSKELKPSDFKHPTSGSGTLSPIAESVASAPSSIDISFIEPGLEGVSIKASAVNPTFAAKILSPVQSPDQAPSRPEPISLDDHSSRRSSPPRKSTSPEGREIKMLEVVSAPANRRLVMNAGHTPNHSLTKLPWMNEADGEATPKQDIIYKGAIDRRASMALSLASVQDDEDEQEGDGDVELQGQLGLVGNAEVDNPFLAALTEKLVEVQKSQPTSPGGSSTSTVGADEKRLRDDDEEEEDMPKLRLKSTSNFGRPMGSM